MHRDARATTTPAPGVRGRASRERILQAATDELTETGDLEVASVAARSGVSVGLPYRYFGTRSGLLIAVIGAFHERLGRAAVYRDYDQPTWAEREQRRVADWVSFLYQEPLALTVLEGMVGDAEVIGANMKRLDDAIRVGARNMAHGQHAGELPADRDPELLAAATLGGTHRLVIVALRRRPRPSAAAVIDEVWRFVAGAVGLPATAGASDIRTRQGGRPPDG